LGEAKRCGYSPLSVSSPSEIADLIEEERDVHQPEGDVDQQRSVSLKYCLHTFAVASGKPNVSYLINECIFDGLFSTVKKN
jgi:hypothetical protein